MRKKILLAVLALCTVFSAVSPMLEAEAASSKSVYVLVKYKGDDPTDYECGKYATNKTIKYTYDENGMLVKRKDGTGTEEYSYDGSKVQSVNEKTKKSSFSSSYIYDNKGKLKTVELQNGYEERLIYDKSKMSGKALYHSEGGNDYADGWSYFYYDNTNSYQMLDYNISKSDGYLSSGHRIWITCDEKGNPISSTEEEDIEIYRSCRGLVEPDLHQTKFEYVYSNGRLTQMNAKDDYDQTWSRYFTYKKISVPSKYVKAVKEQQKRILWNDYVLGITNLDCPGETLNPLL